MLTHRLYGHFRHNRNEFGTAVANKGTARPADGRRNFFLSRVLRPTGRDETTSVVKCVPGREVCRLGESRRKVAGIRRHRAETE